MPNSNGFVVLAGNSNPVLAKKICEEFDFTFGETLVSTFQDGETKVKIKTNLRKRDVFIIQSICGSKTSNLSVNDHLMELILLINAAKLSSAEKITAVIPYYGYGRQDRKPEPHVPISAKVVADMITIAGANRAIIMDLHANQIQGFFNIPVDNLYARPILVKYIQENFDLTNLALASPDAGGAERSRSFAKRLNISDIALIDKRRPAANESEVMHVLGDVTGKVVMQIDDVADTCRTLSNGADAFIESGAIESHAVCTHAITSGKAIETIMNSKLKSIAFTDTVPLGPEALTCEKIKVVSVSNILGKAIKRSYDGESVNELF